MEYNGFTVPPISGPQAMVFVDESRTLCVIAIIVYS